MTHSDLSTDILTLIEEFQRSGARELHVRSGDFELFISNDAAARGSRAGVPAATAVPAPQPALKSAVAALKQASPAGDIPEGAVIVRAPTLGTFYRSPKPGAAPYVEPGASVAPGDALCLIEVMKLFTSVTASMAGRIHAVLVEDGAMVEADQPLFAVVPA